MRSIRSFIRGRTESQRGIVIVIALVLAILYFMLMSLVMIDSSRAQSEAQRFRARMTAMVLAENAAELACRQMITSQGGTATLEDNQGLQQGSCAVKDVGTDPKKEKKFEAHGSAETRGVAKQKAGVFIEGYIDESNVVHIEYERTEQ